jgi:RimJ/RimL family protein N-acetyltransferase
MVMRVPPERYAPAVDRRVAIPKVQPTLTDGVVTLTPFRSEDAATLAGWDHDAEMARWFDWPLVAPSSGDLDDAKQVLERWKREFAAGERIPWAVRDSITGQLLGSVELRPRADGGADASYATSAPYRGRGCAARALRLVRDWGLGVVGFDRIVAEFDSRNEASRRVAKAAGFVEVEEHPGGFRYEANGTEPGDLIVAVARRRADA